jgi:hypothetical protein
MVRGWLKTGGAEKFATIVAPPGLPVGALPADHVLPESGTQNKMRNRHRDSELSALEHHSKHAASRRKKSKRRHNAPVEVVRISQNTVSTGVPQSGHGAPLLGFRL